MALVVGFPMATSEATAHVDEHWGGRGQSVGLAGDEISLLSRILRVAERHGAHWSKHDIDAAINMIRPHDPWSGGMGARAGNYPATRG